MKSVLKEILSTSLYLLCVLAICFLLIKYVGQRTQVEGSSMETTLCDGDNLIVDKISYRFHDPERFDIIVFPYRYEDNTYYINRIIGLQFAMLHVFVGFLNRFHHAVIQITACLRVKDTSLGCFLWRDLGNEHSQRLQIGHEGLATGGSFIQCNCISCHNYEL